MTVAEPPRGLDLRSLKLEATADALRQWAAGTVAELLGSEPDGAAGPECLARLDLGAWRWRRREPARLEKWVLKPLKLRDEEIRLRHPVSWVIARHLRTADRRWKLLPRRKPRPCAAMPEALWPVISAMAWSEPAFQRRLAGDVHEHFRRNRLMSGGDPPLPVWRPQVWWLLLDLVGVPSLGRPPATGAWRWARRLLGRRLAGAVWRRRHRRSRRGRLGARLSEIARVQLGAASGWAGFWEQWLVGEALLRHPELAAEASAESRRTLTVLPLLAYRRYREARNEVALPGSDTAELQRIVDRRWREQQPPLPLGEGAGG